MKKNLFFLSSIFFIMFNSLLVQAEEKNYYLELVSEWNNIFPDQNRNAAGPKFFKHIISKDITYKDFVEFNKLYCAVSGSLIEPNPEPESNPKSDPKPESDPEPEPDPEPDSEPTQEKESEPDA